MSNSRVMKLITGLFEAILAIPILGGTIVLGFSYIPLVIMLILHIVTLFLTNKDKGASAGSILGIITSCLAWIPILGWLLHTITAIVLFINAAMSDKKGQVV